MKKRKTTTTGIIMLGFLIGALLGALLLTLPISARPGQSIGFLDALFVSTSSICVTGLSTVNIGQTFSAFGQVVLLLLIQFGGLGIVTFTTMVLWLFGRRITLADRMLIQSAYNLDTLSGLVRLTMRILKVTLCLEGLGAVGYAIVFIPEYGYRGIWYSIFHAVSAFCNAGIDLLGGNSFCGYRDNVIMNLTTVFLIIVSGLGFPVYWEVARVLRPRRSDGRYGRKMNLQAKIVLTATLALILAGAALTLLFEYDNPATLGPLGWPRKALAALFQSVTLRTAGFATIPQESFRPASCLAYLVLMFIGGSPAGTAGGVKTVTIVMLIASMLANIKGKKDVTVMNRKIADEAIRRCVAIVTFSFSVLMALTVALLAVQRSDFLDTLYEMTSAIATVGLSRGLTGALYPAGKLIVTLTMYLGRIGPITLALVFNSRTPADNISYADSKVIIG
ncbi:TrkH family potassium uptake protein [uncultured Acetatifactor sp.]|jgi:trk system potassium uptake protein TrkH|uniref:TrkH family potassium uptake protein n=1 Tax=uncultured Acetatifactor sp. TaxID=1671927 RepID=UPI0025EA186D|nr:potassium transporter TrkG [uncultured Acetatifactor sp.]MCI8695256.1 potassium transporter KtrB [Lachnospiraceae bacterium]MCI9230663.1 potassium transporter KtrB [Lachnospiraceae bacterium]MCI9651785.1 potassium transporter KtrB [Lachnospiraceae bacterium]